uniref:Nup54 domain-containing protein n=1 Tax=Trichuris muris TaxID=70415 RepID=A0A5S6QJW2_TRIMR
MSTLGSGFNFDTSAIKPASTAQTGGSLFGQAAPATSAFSFGAPSQGVFSFSAPAQPAASTALGAPFGTGSLFGQPGATAKQSFTGSGLFNLGSGTTTAQTAFPSAGFGQTAKPTMDAAGCPSTNAEVLRYIVALTNPQLYGDERDAIIAKLNQLLAFLGCGKAYYANSAPPIEFTPKNPFCRLKFVGYNKRTECRNEQGFVALIIKKKADEVRDNRQLLGDCIYRILGSRPSLAVHVDSVKPLPGERCEVNVFIVETNATTGLKRTIPATESYSFLVQPTIKAQLQSQASVEDLAPKTDILDEKLSAYLCVPPPGFDAFTWNQAQLDNPDKKTLIPWPINGFKELLERHRLQVQEMELQELSLQKVVESLKKADRCSADIQLKLENMKRTQQLLTHRLILIIAAEIMKFKHRSAFDKDEELLKYRLERIDSHLNGPLKIAGRLTEIFSRIRSRPECLSPSPLSEKLDSPFMFDAKLFLQRCQESLEGLITLVQKDMEMLNELSAQENIAPKQR